MVSIGQWGWRPVLIRHVTSQLPAFAHEYAPDWARESKLFTTSRPSGSLSTSMGLRFPNAGTIPVSQRSSHALASKPAFSPDSASMPCTSTVRVAMSSSRAMACSVEIDEDQYATLIVQFL